MTADGAQCQSLWGPPRPRKRYSGTRRCLNCHPVKPANLPAMIPHPHVPLPDARGSPGDPPRGPRAADAGHVMDLRIRRRFVLSIKSIPGNPRAGGWLPFRLARQSDASRRRRRSASRSRIRTGMDGAASPSFTSAHGQRPARRLGVAPGRGPRAGTRNPIRFRPAHRRVDCNWRAVSSEIQGPARLVSQRMGEANESHCASRHPCTASGCTGRRGRALRI